MKIKTYLNTYDQDWTVWNWKRITSSQIYLKLQCKTHDSKKERRYGDKKHTILICTMAYEGSLTISIVIITTMKWRRLLVACWWWQKYTCESSLSPEVRKGQHEIPKYINLPVWKVKVIETSAREQMDLSINFFKWVRDHSSFWSSLYLMWWKKRAGKMTVGCRVIIYILRVIKLHLFLPQTLNASLNFGFHSKFTLYSDHKKLSHWLLYSFNPYPEILKVDPRNTASWSSLTDLHDPVSSKEIISFCYSF